MAKWQRNGALICVILTVAMVCVLGRLVRVGDTKGWSPNVNYTDWSLHNHIYVDDWLLFTFDKRYYNVLEVNETSYLSCNDQGFINNVTRGGRDVVQLTEVRPYYFLSSGGYCWGGMKLVVDVEIPQTPALAPTKSNSISVSWNFSIFLVMLISMADVGYSFRN